MDLLCYDDLDPLAREIDDPLAELEQDVVHILKEAQGSNLDALDRGADLYSEISNTTIETLGARIDAELLKDDRIDVSSSKVAQRDGATWDVAIEIVTNEERLGIALETGSDGSIRKATT